MSGYVAKTIYDGSGRTNLKDIPSNLIDISAMDMEWDENLIKNSHTIGISDPESDTIGSGLDISYFKEIGVDTTTTNFIALFDKEYPNRRNFLRKFAMNAEIEFAVETLCDEIIIYDEYNYYAYPDTNNLRLILKDNEHSKKIVDDIIESFKRVYYAFGFNKGHEAWHYVKKFLIDGFLAFEIIYSDDKGEAKNVIGMKELDPITLQPEIRKDENGNDIRIWVQYKGDTQKQREVTDANIIYISWAKNNFISRLSYVERLIRSFNMWRTMENSRVIWNVQNAQKRLKIEVPIGTQSPQKYETRLNMFRAAYREDVVINQDSGEISINGQPNFSFAKTFVVPVKSTGEKTEIGEIGVEGYDMSGDTGMVSYFQNKFISDTKIPRSRFNISTVRQEGDTSTKIWSIESSGLTYEELSFSNYINRIRSMIRELLLKPLWMQLCIKYPQFVGQDQIKNAIGLIYNEENVFLQAKQQQIMNNAAQTISTLININEKVMVNGESVDRPYFSTEFLVKKFMDLDENDIKLNDKYKKESLDLSQGGSQETTSDSSLSGGRVSARPANRTESPISSPEETNIEEEPNESYNPNKNYRTMPIVIPKENQKAFNMVKKSMKPLVKQPKYGFQNVFENIEK